MVADNRTQLMFEGDFDTIDQAIATLRKATITSPQQVSQSEPVGVVSQNESWQEYYVNWTDRNPPPLGTKLYAAPIDNGIKAAQEALELQKKYYGHGGALHLSMIDWAKKWKALIPTRTEG
jgi:hypothetical protein